MKKGNLVINSQRGEEMPRKSKGAKVSDEISSMTNTSEDIKTSLKKLVIKNFRSIGETPIEIELDKIVVLVGSNNSGKSSILRAYQFAMEGGKITKDDLSYKLFTERGFLWGGNCWKNELDYQHFFISDGFTENGEPR